MKKSRTRQTLLGGALGAGAVVLAAAVLFAGAGEAATADQPTNTSPPTISGTPQEGKTLTADHGDWSNNPTGFDYEWLRCDKNGGSCSSISAATSRQYSLKSVDVGNTLRLRVTARNVDGKASSTSVPTAVIQKAAPPPSTTTATTTTTPSRGNGCPSGSGNPDQVAKVSSPARLLVDTIQSDPAVVGRGAQAVTLRVHVTSTCGGPVQGALVYATATPYNQFGIPPETPTAADGWATLTFQRLGGFPVSRRQQLLALFVRARRPGDSLLGGISTRRLVAVHVDLSR